MSTPFTDRHIGTDAGAQAQMLAALGYETVAELVERAVPASILREPGVASDDGTAEPAAGTAASVIPPAATEASCRPHSAHRGRTAPSATSRMRRRTATMAGPRLSLPVAVTVFPRDIPLLPRTWIEDAYSNLIHYGEAEAGGHFAALEQPQILVDEIRTGLRSVRKGA